MSHVLLLQIVFYMGKIGIRGCHNETKKHRSAFEGFILPSSSRNVYLVEIVY